MVAELFPKLVTLLSFTVLGTAFLLIVRRDLAGQVRLFAAQSLTLAVLAAVVAAFAKSAELAGVAVALALLKGPNRPARTDEQTRKALTGPCRMDRKPMVDSILFQISKMHTRLAKLCLACEKQRQLSPVFQSDLDVHQ